MRFIAVYFVLFLATVSLYAQEYSIKGRIIDEDKTALIGATCIVINPKDSVMVSFGVTDLDGKFELSNVPKGNYKLQITYVGYGTFEKAQTYEGTSKTIDLGDITIYKATNVLDEVTVKAEYVPIVVKKDTIEYTADAFRVRPNANVEELLKKLPGIEVDNDGKITAQGEEVKQVTVDGKKFFGNDPKMATQNLQAVMVNKVQVVDRKSERSQFSGIEDGNTEKVINLELKKDAKLGVFGELMAGYGTDSRYESKALVNKFSNKYQWSGLGTFNNVNQQGFSFQDYASLMGDGGAAFRGNARGPVNFAGRGNGDTKSLSGGTNLTYNLSKKSTFNTSYFLTYVDRTQFEFKNRQNFLGSRTFTVLDTNYVDSYNLGHNINTRLELRPDSVQRLDLEVSYSNNGSDQLSNTLTKTLGVANVLENSTKNDENGNGTNKNLSADVNYSIRLGKPGRIGSVTVNLANSNIDNETIFDQDKFINSRGKPVLDTILQRQISNNDNNNFRVNVNYKEPLGKANYLDVNYTRRNYNVNRIKDFFDLDPFNTKISTLNQELSTLVDNSIIFDRVGLGWSKVTKDINLNAEMVFQHSQIDGKVKEGQPVGKSWNYFVPTLSINFPQKRFNVRYATSVTEPTTTQLQPIVDNSNPLNIYKGNINLQPEYSHDITSRYNYFNAFTLRGFFANLTYRYTANTIVNAVTLNDDLTRITQPENKGASQRLFGNFNFNSPIRPLKIRTRLSTGGSWRKSFNFVNQKENIVNSYGPNARVEIENMNNDKVAITASSRFNYSYNTYSTNSTQNGGFLNQSYAVGSIINFGKGWSLDANLNYDIYSKETYGNNNTVALLNGSITKTFMRNRVTSKLYAFDLLDQNRGIARNVGDTYLEEAITNSIQQYFMMSVIYKLSDFNPNQGGGRGNPMMRF